MADPLQDSITLEPMTNAVMAPCGHSFSEVSIREWLRNHNFCPVCRKDLVDEALRPNYALRAAAEAQPRRRMRAAQRVSPPVSSPASPAAAASLAADAGAAAWKQHQYSALFEGSTIFQRLYNSSFGAFYKALNRVQDPSIRWEDFQLPKVVVIGCESHGKSSLLESITKCAVFPRGESICTRCPVVLRLVNRAARQTPARAAPTTVAGATAVVEEQTATGDETVVKFRGQEWRLRSPDDILARAKAVMDGIGNSVVADELTIEMHEPHIPTFTFVDLPGIRTYPPAMKAETERLARSYLREVGCLVLCVCAATVPRLNALTGLALVMEEHKEQDTIVALTMCDKVGERDIGKYVVDRLLRRTDEFDVHQGGAFRGVVAVINRDSTDTVSLSWNDTAGATRFQAMLQAYADGASGQPDDAETPEEAARQLHEDAINAALMMSVTRLVEKVDIMYHDYICRYWKARALIQVRRLIAENADQIERLGVEPATLNARTVQGALSASLGLQRDPFIAKLPPVPLPGASDMAHGTQCSTTWANQVRATSQAFTRWAATVATCADMRQWAEMRLAAAFTHTTPLRLARFEECRTAMHRRLGSEIARLAAIEQPRICAAAERLLDLLYSTNSAAAEMHLGNFSVATAQQTILGRVFADVLWPALREAIGGEYTAPPLSLTESATLQAERAELRQKAQALRECEQVISNIESALARDRQAQ